MSYHPLTPFIRSGIPRYLGISASRSLRRSKHDVSTQPRVRVRLPSQTRTRASRSLAVSSPRSSMRGNERPSPSTFRDETSWLPTRYMTGTMLRLRVRHEQWEIPRVPITSPVHTLQRPDRRPFCRGPRPGHRQGVGDRMAVSRRSGHPSQGSGRCPWCSADSRARVRDLGIPYGHPQ